MPRRKGPPDMADLHFGTRTIMLQFRATPLEVETMDRALAHGGLESRSALIRHAMYAYARELLSKPSKKEQNAALDAHTHEMLSGVSVNAELPPLTREMASLGVVPRIPWQDKPKTPIMKNDPNPQPFIPPVEVDAWTELDQLTQQTAKKAPSVAQDAPKLAPAPLNLPPLPNASGTKQHDPQLMSLLEALGMSEYADRIAAGEPMPCILPDDADEWD